MAVFNIKFVGEVEKHPVLYNYTLKDYSRKDITEKAWNEVAKEVNLPANDCKEKWRNLRSTLGKNLKPGRSGAKKKEYYLTDAMKFTIPFMKISGANLPPISQHVSTSKGRTSAVPSEEPQQEEASDLLDSTQPADTDQQSDVSPSSPSLPAIGPRSQETSPPPQRRSPSPSSSSPEATPKARKRKRQNAERDADKAFAEYFAAKKTALTKSSSNYDSLRREGIQNFLNSLLPDLLPMTDVQLRQFKRKALSLIDEVTAAHP